MTEYLKDPRFRAAFLKLLELKDAEVRIRCLEQCHDAVDKSIHIGGAFSATIPLVALYYGGFMDFDVEQPTEPGQDLFALSKGHAVAALAAIYADLGYFDNSVLKNSRSFPSILNGHPGPILPGIHIATGPLGQGIGVCQGFALIGQEDPQNDVFCVCSDGEFQEGPVWEALNYSVFKRLDNLCLIVDHNFGQLDNPHQLVVPFTNLAESIRSFGWRVETIDGTRYDPVVDSLARFRTRVRDGRPTAIVCHTSKGFGGFSSFMTSHKVTITDELIEQEVAQQDMRRERRRQALQSRFARISDPAQREAFISLARGIHVEIETTAASVSASVLCRRAPERDKAIRYDPGLLPKIEEEGAYAATDIIKASMKVFSQDRRVASMDADLSSTSGLFDGISWVDRARAHNVGVAESNMMLIGEAYAAQGFNTWVSTFCPFFDWKVLRRVAVGHQERLEAIEMADGWLSEGHGLDLTFLATAPNFETQTNGATHMGNDDILVFGAIAHLKIIDVSCPRQLLSILRWIMEGNRGLIYLRVMRSASDVIYNPEFEFGYGQAYTVMESVRDQAVIVSSGRGVHEALGAARLLAEEGVHARVVDMPSPEAPALVELYESGLPLVIAEQNNGFIWHRLLKALGSRRQDFDPARIYTINALDDDGNAQFIHSGTYAELTGHFGLTAAKLAASVKGIVSQES
jgi:transketolase